MITPQQSPAFAWKRFATVVGLAGVAFSSFTSCQTSARAISKLHEVNTSKYYAVSSEKTPFYQHGPQQGNGPDMELPRDTLVNLVRHSFGYAKVQLASSGQQGYVASDDIKPASPVLVASLTATPPPIMETAPTAPTAEYFDPNPGADFTPPPPEGLPEPDLPPALPEATPVVE